MKTRLLFIFTIIVLMCFVVMPSSAATIYSAGNIPGTVSSAGVPTGGGLWSATSTWAGGVVPTINDDVVIVNGDLVIVAATTTAANFTIQSGGSFCENGAVISATTIGAGTFTMASNSSFYVGGGATKLPSDFGTYTIDAHSNTIWTTAGSSTVLNTAPLTVGNLIIYKTGSVAGGNLVVLGDLTVASSSGFKGCNATHGNGGGLAGTTTTHHVYGNVYISGTATLVSAIDAPSAGETGIWNIDGNVSVTGTNCAFIPVSASDGGILRTGIINIAGNLSLSSGAKFEAGTSTSSTGTAEVCTINLGGNFTIDNTVVTATNTKGIFSFNFVGTGTQTVTLGAPVRFASGSMLATANTTIVATSNVVFNSGLGWSSTTTGTNGAGQWTVNGGLMLGANDTLKGVQSFMLNSGATLATANANGLASNGNIQTTGTQTYSTGANYIYNGTVAQVTGTLVPSTVNNLTISNTSGVTLTNSVTVTGTCSIASGASLIESPGKYVLGTTTITRAVGTGASTFGGIGVSVDAGADDLGNVSVSRLSGLSGAITIGPNSGINRSWNIVSDNVPSSGRNLTLTWDSGDDGSIASDLTTARIWKSTDSGTSWFAVGSIHDVTSARTITENVTSFSRWTVSNGTNLLPVQMTSFTANVLGQNAELSWKTETESDNYGFDVERRAIPNGDWSKIGFRAGAGTSSSSREYTFADNDLAAGKYSYRLKQMDHSGVFKYSMSTEIEIMGMPKEFKLAGNYPNPFNPSTKIQFTVPENGRARLRIYNLLGQEVANLFDGPAIAGNLYAPEFHASGLPSGLYFSVLEFGGKQLTSKMVLAK